MLKCKKTDEDSFGKRKLISHETYTTAGYYPNARKKVR